jgi:hypothetical protein
MDAWGAWHFTDHNELVVFFQLSWRKSISLQKELLRHEMLLGGRPIRPQHLSSYSKSRQSQFLDSADQKMQPPGNHNVWNNYNLVLISVIRKTRFL